ncbi:GATA zinc finger domain-containing protein 10 [Cladobotryum mycophilum]|uniref:GATA zinc finger domain-containing protein 10 n=1 Tax=Cladobotryum mycophilum TaxID=491253 RepID=A0ABR0S5V0_9HYPO
MAAATVLPPSSHYQSQPSYSAGYSQQPSNMISPEPRRSSDEGESSSRQSLPSISEVISGTRPSQYAPSAHAPLQPGSSLPSPFTSGARQNLSPIFGFAQAPFNGRSGLPPVTDRRPSPPAKHDVPPPHHMSESQKSVEHHPMNGTYPQPPPPHASVPYQSGQLPPGQQPLPPYQVSPRHGPSHGPSQYDPRAAPPPRHEEADYAGRSRYDSNPLSSIRGFENWSYQENLSRIGSYSRTVFNFAEAYGRIAQEQHGSTTIPERLPTEREVNDMLANIDFLKRSLEQVREAVLVSIANERNRDNNNNINNNTNNNIITTNNKPKGSYDEDPDIHMYSDSVKPHYITEVKKRRGRAAPPGRCHSCNRIDTPEWRRGPDGARTLCNACGLHYAKLERKRQLEARSIRPKPEDSR